MRNSLFAGLLLASVAAGQTPTFSQVYNFAVVTNTTTGAVSWPNGYSPPGPLLQASDGNFYGTASLGGTDGGQCTGASGTHACGGTIFQLTPAGKLTVLYTFAWGSAAAPYANGNNPNGGLVEGPDGYLYGTTKYGGNGSTQSPGRGDGVIFKISKTGQFQILHSFCTGTSCPEGLIPTSLVLGRDGKFYGITTQGTTTIFRISASGVLEMLHAFKGIPDGGGPTAPLIQASDCNFYGTTSGGGADTNADGTVFRLTPGGVYTVVHSFSSVSSQIMNGRSPEVGLVQGTNGKLYGVTKTGGLYGSGTVFELGLDGTFRKIFDLQESKSAGEGLRSTPLFASDGNLWGTSQISPVTYVYSVSLDGVMNGWQVMCPGAGPEAGTSGGALIQGADGKIYGVNGGGGCASNAPLSGTIFSVDAALPKLPNPVVNAVTNGASFGSGMLVGGEIATVFGTNLTGSTGINLTSSLPLPDSFLNSTVLVNGCAATPLFAVDNVNGQQQINFQAPWEIDGQQAVAVQVVNNGGISPAVDIAVSAAQPGIINYSSGGNTYGAILHADYSLASNVSPAKAGETVLIYGTGFGAVSTAQVDGTAANGEWTVALPAVTIGGASAMVTFSGLAPGFVGLNQVNVMVPSGMASGNQPVVMNVGGVNSNSVLLPVR